MLNKIVCSELFLLCSRTDSEQFLGVLKRTCEHVGLQNVLATKNCCESDDPYNIIMVTGLNQRG